MCILFFGVERLFKPFSVLDSRLYIKNNNICFISAALA